MVTGGNKGIGFEICKQLASQGILVVLTARDVKKGNEAFEKLKDSGLSENVVFHQLDVVEPASIASLVDFIESHFGKLDILVTSADPFLNFSSLLRGFLTILYVIFILVYFSVSAK